MNILETNYIHSYDINDLYRELNWTIENMQENSLTVEVQYSTSSWGEGRIMYSAIILGRGITGVACKNTNRSFTGIEKEEQYFNIDTQRLED